MILEKKKTNVCKGSRLTKNVVCSALILSGLAANYLWVLMNLRYLGTAMQDHQVLKTMWTKIMNILRTEFFKVRVLPLAGLPLSLIDSALELKCCASNPLRVATSLLRQMRPLRLADPTGT